MKLLSPLPWTLPLLLGGCASEIADPGPSPIRRLTRHEYDNTVFHLLGDTTRPARRFAPDEEALGFDNQAAAQTVSPLLAEQLQLAAETLAERHQDDLLELAPGCADDNVGDCTASAPAFVAQFGRRAFRRPSRMMRSSGIPRYSKPAPRSETEATTGPLGFASWWRRCFSRRSSSTGSRSGSPADRAAPPR